MTGADGDGATAGLGELAGGVGAADEHGHVGIFRATATMVRPGLFIRGGDLKETGDVAGYAVAPEAVVVNERSEAVDL